MTDTFVLQELLIDPNVPFRVHNVKLDKFICQNDLPMMFLSHFDSLDDTTKSQKNHLLIKHLNDKVTAQEACQILTLPAGTIRPATHIKITGTTVIVLDDFPLAVHLQFTNTAKETQTIYGNDLTALVAQEAKNFVLSGNVNVLHKTPTKTLISVDLEDNEYPIAPADGYARLPNTHALATTQVLNTLKHNSPQVLQYLGDAILAKVMAHCEAQTLS